MYYQLLLISVSITFISYLIQESYFSYVSQFLSISTLRLLLSRVSWHFLLTVFCVFFYKKKSFCWHLSSKMACCRLEIHSCFFFWTPHLFLFLSQISVIFKFQALHCIGLCLTQNKVFHSYNSSHRFISSIFRITSLKPIFFFQQNTYQRKEKSRTMAMESSYSLILMAMI